MIFITVGTHHLQFDRLLNYIDRLIKQKVISKKDLVIQSGTSKKNIPGVKQQALYSHKEFLSYIKKAGVIISAAGPATIFQTKQQNKKPIIVPRQKKYKEHVGDHQIFFAQQLAQKKQIYHARNYKELKKILTKKKNSNFYTKNKNAILSKQRLINSIKKYLNSIELNKS